MPLRRYGNTIALAAALLAGAAAGAASLAGASQDAEKAAPWDWGDTDESWNSGPEYEPSKSLCRQLRGRGPPRSDRPDAATARSLRGCDSEALYYGIGMPADPARARQCAILEMEADDPGSVPPFGGRAMLTTIYANGVGARRDLDLAIHLACGVEGAPMESHGRVMHLAELRRQRAPGRDFHICDDITSGMMGGQCAGHRARIAQAQRAAALAALTRGWTDPERRALAPLIAARTAYSQAHASGEVDARGTLRGAFWVQAQEALERQFLDMLQHLSAGRRIPAPHDFAAADQSLNAAYRARMRGEFDDDPGAVTREGVRDAQRAWLRYRDAFLAFAAVKYPRVTRGAIAAWLTRQRTALLRDGPPY